MLRPVTIKSLLERVHGVNLLRWNDVPRTSRTFCSKIVIFSQIINLLYFSIIFIQWCHTDESKKKATNLLCTIWSLIMVRNRSKIAIFSRLLSILKYNPDKTNSKFITSQSFLSSTDELKKKTIVFGHSLWPVNHSYQRNKLRNFFPRELSGCVPSFIFVASRAQCKKEKEKKISWPWRSILRQVPRTIFYFHSNRRIRDSSSHGQTFLPTLYTRRLAHRTRRFFYGDVKGKKAIITHGAVPGAIVPSSFPRFPSYVAAPRRKWCAGYNKIVTRIVACLQKHIFHRVPGNVRLLRRGEAVGCFPQGGGARRVAESRQTPLREPRPFASVV